MINWDGQATVLRKNCIGQATVLRKNCIGHATVLRKNSVESSSLMKKRMSSHTTVLIVIIISREIISSQSLVIYDIHTPPDTCILIKYFQHFDLMDIKNAQIWLRTPFTIPVRS